MRVRLVRLAVLCAALVAFAAPSSAQVYTGRIDVTVADSTGAILPGATVEVTGPRDASAVTDAQGEAHFLNLPPGVYAVTANMTGFTAYSNKNVPVVAGGGVPLRIALSVSGVTQTVEVAAESPIVDPRRTTTQTNVTLLELQEVPTARDPWVVLQTVPGVIIDRVNVGGAESGQQSVYQAKGASRTDNTWNIDGIPITDMAATGASPAYYDFDMFQEMQVTTGGADLQSATGGVGLNLVLKSGSNTPRGSARYYFENEKLQSKNMPEELQARLGGASGQGNRIDKYKDYGFELGGPLWRDKLWAWGAFGKTDITVLTFTGAPDQTILENYSFKGTGQVSNALRAGFTFFRGEKLKYGRGAGPTRDPETTWNQGGPTQLYKGELNYVAGNNLFLTGRYGYVDGGFFLTPQGGLDAQWVIDDTNTWRGSTYHYQSDRPQWNASADGNMFKGRNEVKFGFAWRRTDVDSATIVPGNGIITYHVGYPTMEAEVTAWGNSTSSRSEYMSAYLGDTISWDRLTLNAGVRWDRAAASVKPFTTGENVLLPDLLPPLTGVARDDVLVFNVVTPRLGVTYALDEGRKTIARASYGMFASQLSATAGNFLSTAQSRGIYYYPVFDANGNRFVDASELAGVEPYDWYGFDINNPLGGDPIHRVGDYKTPISHEIQFGLDREVLPQLGVSGTVTWRHFTNFNWMNNGLHADDYVQIDTLTGSHDAIGNYSVPIYGVIPERIPANRAANTYEAREGYSQRFVGFEFSATKRMANRWMARFGFSTNRHTEYFDGPSALVDPTSSPASPNIDGGEVMIQDTASGKQGFYAVLPKYQFILTGAYQAPWGINLGVNMLSRQGFARPYHRTGVPTDDPIALTKSVLLVPDVTDYRLPTLTSLDARVGKEFRFGRTRFNVDLDVFNALNTATVLRRQYDLRTASSADTVLEIMNPRVLRLGVRFNF